MGAQTLFPSVGNAMFCYLVQASSERGTVKVIRYTEVDSVILVLLPAMSVHVQADVCSSSLETLSRNICVGGTIIQSYTGKLRYIES